MTAIIKGRCQPKRDALAHSHIRTFAHTTTHTCACLAVELGAVLTACFLALLQMRFLLRLVFVEQANLTGLASRSVLTWMRCLSWRFP